MTNSELLKERIKASGLKISFIAAQLGISRAALCNKIKGRTAFNQFEIANMCKTLGIKTLAEKEALFFAEIVD